MAFYVCFATGLADCTPNDQSYHSFETVEGLRYAVREACEMWERELIGDNSPSASEHFYSHEFRAPREGENNWSQRLRIASDCDWVLDVIGMTADEYARETECD